MIAKLCSSISLLSMIRVIVIGFFAHSSIPAIQAAEKMQLTEAKSRIEEVIQHQLKLKSFPGVSLAWIIDGKIVHAAGYGFADPEKKIPASPEMICRCGSISKLFNAVATMQMVEQGKLDLDAPIEKALPDFRISNPYVDDGPITIRQMLCHRSGMVREAPVGGYFDDTNPGIAKTIASIADCTLVNRPNEKTRYSNVGPTITGHAVEKHSGLSFVDYQQKFVLDPLGMKSSTWIMNKKFHPQLAKGEMRVNNGDGTFRTQFAPEFELGTLPAGNLYTTVNDLAKFAAFVMDSAPDSGPKATILRRDTLKEMFTQQLTKEENAARTFGLGFALGKHRDHSKVHHMGMVYGFSSAFTVLPEAKIGVVVLANVDITRGPVVRIVDDSIDLLLAVRNGEPLPEPLAKIELSDEKLKEYAGDYESESYWAKIEVVDHKLRANISTQELRLTPHAADKFIVDGTLTTQEISEFSRVKEATKDQPTITGFKVLRQEFKRIDPAKIQSQHTPNYWKTLVGSYGPDFIPVVVSIRNGKLFACVENEYDYKLTPKDRAVFGLPSGLYTDENVVFQFDASGKVTGMFMANIYLPRRD